MCGPFLLMPLVNGNTSTVRSCYSYRSAVIGSTRAARRAGQYAASTAAAESVKAATQTGTGSLTFTPNSIPATSRAATNTNGRPIKSPLPISANDSSNTIPNTVDRGAPNAIRIPNSPVRRATAYDITP